MVRHSAYNGVLLIHESKVPLLLKEINRIVDPNVANTRDAMTGESRVDALVRMNRLPDVALWNQLLNPTSNLITLKGQDSLVQINASILVPISNSEFVFGQNKGLFLSADHLIQ
jgi:hypothetical protein